MKLLRDPLVDSTYSYNEVFSEESIEIYVSNDWILSSRSLILIFPLFSLDSDPFFSNKVMYSFYKTISLSSNSFLYFYDSRTFFFAIVKSDSISSVLLPKTSHFFIVETRSCYNSFIFFNDRCFTFSSSIRFLYKIIQFR